MIFDRIALARIEEALRNGEFDNLPGRGKRIDLDEYFAAPEELRMAYGLLKNSNVLPAEAELLKEIADLEHKRKACTDSESCRELLRAIEQRRLSYRLMIERYRKRK